MRIVKNTTHGPRVTISGDIDGSNKEFTASHGIAPGTEDFVCVYLNGVLQHEGAGGDYTLGSFMEVLKVHFDVAPNPGSDDKLDFIYYAIGGA